MSPHSVGQDESGGLGEIVRGDLDATIPGCQGACRSNHHDVGAVAVDVGVNAYVSHSREGLVGNGDLFDELGGTFDLLTDLVAILFPSPREANGVVFKG